MTSFQEREDGQIMGLEILSIALGGRVARLHLSRCHICCFQGSAALRI